MTNELWLAIGLVAADVSLFCVLGALRNIIARLDALEDKRDG